METMIQLRQVALAYQTPGGEVEALQSVSFAVEAGEFCAIVGPSGCGKSTILSLLAGLLPLSEGEILIGGRPAASDGGLIGFMPQQDQLFEWRSIWNNVTLGLNVQKNRSSEQRDAVRSMLRRYGLAEFADKKPSQLSGGMRQRCALIRTLAVNPQILLLDEPFSALDYQTRLSVSADIQQIIRQEGKTALLVTHDISEAISLSDRVIVLSARPAVVKAVHDLSALRALSPKERRDSPEFHKIFNDIWKELDLYG